ncbi:hypothetical protein BGZ46_001822 [Entomortierella lignicola]|nr:hypothetical protein BGZ46_001822 [Entomortierella lignicola]
MGVASPSQDLQRLTRDVLKVLSFPTFAINDEAESSRTRKKSRPAKANDDDTNEESSARKEKKKVGIIVEKEEVDDDEWEDGEEEKADKADPDYTSSVRSSLTTIDMRYINNLNGHCDAPKRRFRGFGPPGIKFHIRFRVPIATSSRKDKQNFESAPLSPSQKEDLEILANLCSFAAANTYLNTKKHFDWKDNEEIDLQAWAMAAADVFPQTRHPLSTFEQDTYMQAFVNGVIDGVFGDMNVADHWTRDPLPTPIGFEEIYLPDYFAKKDGFAFAVVEVKKPVADGTCLQADQRKVPSMMKIMLDMMYTAGVKDPVTLGFVIAKSRCDIYNMSVEHEALYMYKLVGSFELPKTNIQLGLLFTALAPLTAAQMSYSGQYHHRNRGED